MGAMDAVIRRAASTMMKTFGQTVRLQERQSGDYDTSSATVSVMKIEHEVQAIVGDFTEKEVHGLVKSGDKKVLVAAKDLPRTPTVEWRVKIGDRWYEIHHVMTTYSGDDPAVHQILARGK